MRVARALFEDAAFRAFTRKIRAYKGGDVTVILVDDRRRKKPVWAHTTGKDTIEFGYVAKNAASDESLRITIAHELGHTINPRGTEWFGKYGKDGHHGASEIIRAKAAFSEGFSDFIAALWEPAELARRMNAAERLFFEKGGDEHDPWRVSVTDPSLSQRLHNESVICLLLSRISRLNTDGIDRVLRAVTTAKPRLFGLTEHVDPEVLDDVLGRYSKMFPADGEGVAAALDVTTGLEASAGVLSKFLPDQVVRSYLARIRPKLTKHLEESSQTAAGQTPASERAFDEYLRLSGRRVGR